MTVHEIHDVMESYARMERRNYKRKVTDDFILAKAIAHNVSVVISGQGDLANPWDYHEELFSSDKNRYEIAKKEHDMQVYLEQRREYAKEFNNRRKQQGM